MLVNQFGQFALPFDEPVHFVIVHRFGELHPNLLIFFQVGSDLPDTLHHYLLHCLVVIKFRLLRQVAHVVARREDHLPLEGFVFARNDFQQGGFSGAVQTQHPDFRPVIKGEIDIFQNCFPRVVRLADIYHGKDNLLVVHIFMFYYIILLLKFNSCNRVL